MVVCLTIYSLGAPDELFAYVDPGAGSVILQVLLSGIAAAAFTAKHWWRKLRDAIRKLRPPLRKN
jgi:hypothetical protein